MSIRRASSTLSMRPTLERNLYLTLQLMELRIPTVLALNMMDEVRENGGTIDVAAMEQELGIPVVPISASQGRGGGGAVCARGARGAGEARSRRRIDFCAGDVHRAIHSIAHIIEDQAELAGVSASLCRLQAGRGRLSSWPTRWG